MVTLSWFGYQIAVSLVTAGFLAMIWVAGSLAAAAVAGFKGRSRLLFFIYGLVACPLALAHAILIHPNKPAQ